MPVLNDFFIGYNVMVQGFERPDTIDKNMPVALLKTHWAVKHGQPYKACTHIQHADVLQLGKAIVMKVEEF